MKSRFIIVAGSVMIMFVTGSIFSFSALTVIFGRAGFSEPAVTLSSTLCYIFAFLFSIISAIKLIFKFNLKKLAIFGGLIISVAYICMGTLNSTNSILLILFGIVSGIGFGITWVVPFSVSLRWFPDRIGLMSGLLLFAPAFGAMCWVKIAGSWGNLLADYGLFATLIIFGILFFCTIFLSSFAMTDPPDTIKLKKTALNIKSFLSNSQKLSQTIRNNKLYLIALGLTSCLSAGILTLQVMKIYFIDSQQLSGIPQAQAFAVSGTAIAVFFPLANGLGRIIWGWISDIFSRKISIIILSLFQAIIILILYFFSSSAILLYIAVFLYGLNLGGIYTLFTALTADIFGIKYVVQNVLFIYFIYQLVSVIFVFISGILLDSNNVFLIFIISSVICLMTIPLVYKVQE